MQLYAARTTTRVSVPLVLSHVQAGFPSPADDYLEGSIDLNEHLIERPASTYLVRIIGNSMVQAGIFAGDLVVVDRSLTPKHNDIVLAQVDNEITIKRLHRQGGRVQLRAENKAYPPIDFTDETELVIWGVVVHSIREFKH